MVLPSASRGSIAPLARALRPVQAVMASHRGLTDVSGEDEAVASRLLGSWWDDLGEDMRLSALSLPDKTPDTKGECMSDRERPTGLHTYTTRER